MDVKHLNYILAIARWHNMTKAAEELYVSQSSLSQYLSRLEQNLGTPLFYRNKNELTLTPAGRLYVEAAQKVVAIQKELYRDIASLSQQSHITVAVTSNFGLRMLSEIIPRFKKQYPRVSIEITETSLPRLKQLFLEDALDLGIAAEISATPFGDRVQLLRREEVFFAIPRLHPYAVSHPCGTLTPGELIRNFSGDHFLLSRKGSSLRMLTDRFFDSCGFSPTAFCETNNISTTRRMIASNTGVAFIGESCLADREHIAYYALTPRLERLNLLVHGKNRPQSEPENVFYSLLLDYFHQNTENPYLTEHVSGSQD